jgi:hypothetical protein
MRTHRSRKHLGTRASGSFDLHAGRTVGADDRAGLERVCHYLLRPPLAQERVEILPNGRVGLTLAHAWADGTRALVFEPSSSWKS